MDKVYGVLDYADKPFITLKNLIFPPDYPAFLTVARIPIFGSDDFSGQDQWAKSNPVAATRPLAFVQTLKGDAPLTIPSSSVSSMMTTV
ncbi:hypothetical protein VIGAN_04118800 [Vigna angularis var. angularis]|uniref:Uncharacterized protein n=1 Tax=Vigna angularis var. angularis TaxID=157739 RepID=A0A0S3RTM9_PHAAN|nr:hypothetical protein VIGAN_04118800 [Vigna angularis var. angularis]